MMVYDGDGYDYGDSYGSGYGYGSSNGYGNGDGYGNGYGYGDGTGDGYGYGFGGNILLPQYSITALSLPWAIVNASVERSYG